MSQCVVPNWNLGHQRQEQVEEEGNNRSSHVHSHSQHHHLSSDIAHLVPNPMSNYEVAELTWENGQLAMHGLGGLLPSAPTKPTWGRSNDTLESIVHHATYHNQNLDVPQLDHQTPANISSMVASSGSGGKLDESSSQVPVVPGLLKKRTRLDSDQCGRKFNGSIQEKRADRSACASASASAIFCRDDDTTMMTWASYESPRSLKTSKTADEDSTSHGGSENRDDEDHETRGEMGRSQSTRRSRAAATHNQSERRRRDRINQKMKALQKLVPNASKTDKASMLDEVIEYLKQLQAQVQMMSMRTPQMMMPLGMQQHLQMSSLLARMGMGVGLGMGMGMLDMNTMARNSSQTLPSLIHPSSSTHTFVPPPFIVPPMIPMRTPTQPNQDPGTNSPVPLPDPYCAFLAQSMNIDLYNKMAALYQQQVNQTMQASSSPSQSNHAQEE